MEQLYKHSDVYRIISKDISEGMLNHSYMLISNDKVYVEILAKAVAMHVLCKNHGPCFGCGQCVKASKNEHADLVVLPQAKKAIQTDDVDSIVEESFVMPLEADKKIYVLNSFELATVQAQNKLLKTLEEPPSSVVFVLTTTNDSNVLATIKSRCKKIYVASMDQKKMTDYLIRSGYVAQNVDKVLALSNGNLTTALSFLTDDKLLNMQNLCEEIFHEFSKSNEVLRYSAKIQEYADEMSVFLNLLLSSLHKVAITATLDHVGGYNMEMVSGISKLITNSQVKLKANCSIEAVIDTLLLGILEVKYKCKK